MPRKLGRALLLLMAIVASPAACNVAELPTPQPAEPRAITVWDTYYVRFQVDGVWHHAVSGTGDDFLPGQHRFVGPTYVRRAGEELWQCHPSGYQIPQGAEVMMSSSRAPVTVTTMVGVCQ